MGDRIAVMHLGVLQQVGHAGGALHAARERVRRRVHRLAGDEPRARRAGRVGRERVLRNGDFVVRVPERFLARSRGAAGPGRSGSGRSTSQSRTAACRAPACCRRGRGRRVPRRRAARPPPRREVPLVAKLPIEPRLAAGDAVTLALPLEKLYLFDRETESALSVAA